MLAAEKRVFRQTEGLATDRKGRRGRPGWFYPRSLSWSTVPNLRTSAILWSECDWMILALNVGSSSLKYSLFDRSDLEATLSTGVISRIGDSESQVELETDGQRSVRSLGVKSHADAAAIVFDWLAPQGILSDPNLTIAHRVVHGGPMTSHAVIDMALERKIESAGQLAPLHNPPALSVIRRTRDLVGEEIVMVAVFDTAFFAAIPEVASRYPIPWAMSERHGIRKYGFHGIAHQWMMNASARILDRSPDEIAVVTLQLGNGCSAALVVNGHAMDTSMGMTPLEGLMMGTRSGSIDPAIVAILAEREDLSVSEVVEILNSESGLKGVSGVSSDWRDTETAAASGDRRARIALEMFAYRVRKQVGAYMAAAPQKIDAIVFGGGIGEHSSALRQMVVGGLDHLGVVLNGQKNESKSTSELRIVSESKSSTQVMVGHIDEMRVVAEVASAVKQR